MEFSRLNRVVCEHLSANSLEILNDKWEITNRRIWHRAPEPSGQMFNIQIAQTVITCPRPTDHITAVILCKTRTIVSHNLNPNM